MPPDMGENKTVVRRLGEALNTGKVDAGLEFLADPWTYNAQPLARETLLQIRTPVWTAVPDIHWTLERVVAEGDWVAAHWKVSGTYTGDLAHPAMGTVPASGKPISFSLMNHYRIADGQIAEVWEVGDCLGLLQQLGVILVPEQS